MRHTLATPLAAVGLVLCAIGPVLAVPSCLKAERKVEEAAALRFQAREEARIGNHDRVCDTLDEVGDRYAEARDEFEDCGAGIVAIDLRSESRALRIAKAVNHCD